MIGKFRQLSRCQKPIFEFISVYYLKPDNVSIQENASLVFNELGEAIEIDSIFHDEKGIFTTPSSQNSISDGKVWNILYCKTCEDYTPVNIQGKCTRCGNKHSDPPK